MEEKVEPPENKSENEKEEVERFFQSQIRRPQGPWGSKREQHVCSISSHGYSYLLQSVFLFSSKVYSYLLLMVLSLSLNCILIFSKCCPDIYKCFSCLLNI